MNRRIACYALVTSIAVATGCDVPEDSDAPPSGSQDVVSKDSGDNGTSGKVAEPVTTGTDGSSGSNATTGTNTTTEAGGTNQTGATPPVPDRYDLVHVASAPAGACHALVLEARLSTTDELVTTPSEVGFDVASENNESLAFFADASCADTVDRVAIRRGQSAVRFFFRATVANAHTTIRLSPLSMGTAIERDVRILPTATRHLVASVLSERVIVGVPLRIQVTLVDEYGNPAEPESAIGVDIGRRGDLEVDTETCNLDSGGLTLAVGQTSCVFSVLSRKAGPLTLVFDDRAANGVASASVTTDLSPDTVDRVLWDGLPEYANNRLLLSGYNSFTVVARAYCVDRFANRRSCGSDFQFLRGNVNPPGPWTRASQNEDGTYSLTFRSEHFSATGIDGWLVTNIRPSTSGSYIILPLREYSNTQPRATWQMLLPRSAFNHAETATGALDRCVKFNLNYGAPAMTNASPIRLGGASSDSASDQQVLLYKNEADCNNDRSRVEGEFVPAFGETQREFYVRVKQCPALRTSLRCTLSISFPGWAEVKDTTPATPRRLETEYVIQYSFALPHIAASIQAGTSYEFDPIASVGPIYYFPDKPNDTYRLVSVTSGSAGGSVAIVAGQIVYRPADGFSGRESFTYTVESSGFMPMRRTESVTMTVVPET